MNEEKINNRLEELSAVLYYDCYCEFKHFTPGEKIVINQERGSLYDQLNVINGELDPSKAREFKVPDELEKKIEFVINKIHNERKPN